MLMPYTIFVYSSLKPHILINALILLLNSLLIFMLFLFSSVLLRRNIIHVWRMTSTKGMIRLNSIHTSISFMEPVRGRESDTLINLVKIIVKAFLVTKLHQTIKDFIELQNLKCVNMWQGNNYKPYIFFNAF